MQAIVSGHSDSGASHNFICPKLVQLAGLETLTTSDFVVKVGNGQQVTSHGDYKGEEMHFPNLLVAEDFYLFPLEGSKVVLGLP